MRANCLKTMTQQGILSIHKIKTSERIERWGKHRVKKPFISQIWDSKTSTIENLWFFKILNLGLYLSRKVYFLERLSNYFEWRKVLFASRACDIGKMKRVISKSGKKKDGK